MNIYYQIIGMERIANGRWRFVARPVSEKDIRFECSDSRLEDIIWDKAKSGSEVRLDFETTNEIALLKRIYEG